MPDWSLRREFDFAALCEQALAPLLTGVGFRRHTGELRDQEVVYRRGPDGAELEYVRTRTTIHPLDRPWEVLVTVAQGALEYPEADWNGLPLWKMVEDRTGETRGYSLDSLDSVLFESTPRGTKTYSVGSLEAVLDALKAVASDLEEHADDFLSGDLTRFYTLRAAQNRTREPDRIYRRESDGSLTGFVDPESEALRRRFSAEPGPGSDSA